jgi:phage terminase large subunit-like protein
MPEFHKDWYKQLLFPDNLVGLILVTFRESAKTSLTKIKLIHTICYSKKKFIIWTSFDQRKAEANLYDIALELQTNKRLIADFGQLFFEKKVEEKYTKKKSIGEFITTNKIKVKAYSTGQSPRGEVYGEYRPDLIVLDDIETLITIESEAKTQNVMDYIDELLAGLSGDANVIVLGNRLLEGGSITYLEDKVKNDPNWKTYDIPVTINGEIVWKTKYTETDEQAQILNTGIEDKKKQVVSLETKKRLLGYQAYNREMLNTPITDEEREFKPHWIDYITPEELEAKKTRRYLTIDTAISEKSSADSTGIVDNAIDRDNYWNLRAYKFRINPKELIDLLFTWHENNNYDKIGIEKTIYLQAIKPFLDEEMRNRNKFLPIVELQHNSTAKETRIRGLIPRYSNKGVRHVKNECNDLEKEMFMFPKGLHDDVLDACAYQEQIAESGGTKKAKQFRPKL